MSSTLQNVTIAKLLSQHTRLPTEDDGAADNKRRLQVVYAMFLECDDENEEASSASNQGPWLHRLLVNLAKRFSANPVVMPMIVHCEVLVPPIPDSAGGRINFATYLGSDGAQWQNRESLSEQRRFYLEANGFRWRALPVLVDGDVQTVRRIADDMVGAPYSIAMYLTSASLFRGLSRVWDDSPRASGHCAVITARLLKKSAGADKVLHHASAWYSPSTLYDAVYTNHVKKTDCQVRDSLTSSNPAGCTTAISHLLHDSLDTGSIERLGDEECSKAVMQLTNHVYVTAQSGTAEDARAAQKELATSLLKWSLLRAPP